MPLIRLQKINDNSWLGLWRVEEEMKWFYDQIDLSKEDTYAYSKISNELKKFEWLSTRMVMKALVKEMGIEYMGIIKDDHGKPFLRECSFPISVTHSYPYVSAIIHRNLEVGIDLEKLKNDKILRIAKKFTNPREYAFANENPRILTLIWCAKESLYKLHGRKFVVFRENLEVEPFEPFETGELTGWLKLETGDQAFKLNYETTQHFFITYTVR